MSIIYGKSEAVPKSFEGCDFVLQLGEKRKGTEIRLLQLTDMQIIDSFQRRTPDRLKNSEINAWIPENFDIQCKNHIKSVISQTKPDMIFITGDMVYGSFDDKGTTFEYFCNMMSEFDIPWAPVFGNHDNESKMGVKWQCEMLEKTANCMFRRGDVSGNCNFTVGVATGDELVRVFYMLDSNGCCDSEDPDVIREKGIFDDQIKMLEDRCLTIKRSVKRCVPGCLAFHIPIDGFQKAEKAKGYASDNVSLYQIGVSVPQKDDDFGGKMEKYIPITMPDSFDRLMKDCAIDGVFMGHCHKINTCIEYDGIKWVFGLKTGQYDYHMPGQLGGTLVTLKNSGFDVRHVPALVPYAPYPLDKRIFKENFFAEDKYIV